MRHCGKIALIRIDKQGAAQPRMGPAAQPTEVSVSVVVPTSNGQDMSKVRLMQTSNGQDVVDDINDNINQAETK